MKILIDINHPAHVHYFKNFIKIMENKGHEFVITNRDSQLINYLLDKYNIKHIVRCKRPEKNSFFNSLFYLFKMIYDVYKTTKKEKVDLFVGFASPACSIVSYLRGKPSILVDDTEHNHINHFIYLKFCSVVLTPNFFKKKLGKKQLKFSAYIEQFYLNDNYFKENEIYLKKPYVLFRFISYDARHDSGVKENIDENKKIELVKKISQNFNVYVSHENENIMNNDFYKNYKLKIDPEKIHDVLSHAQAFISEGATMATEAALLGTETYYINPLSVGNINSLAENYTHCKALQGEDLLKDYKTVGQNKIDKNNIKSRIKSTTIDLTSFFVWFVENYPKSDKIMKENPDYQFNFT